MKSKISLPSSRKIFFLLLLFIYIYAPPLSFVPLGINKLIAPFTIVALLFGYKSMTQKVLLQKHLFIAISLLCISIIYAFAIDTSSIYSGNLAFTRKQTFSQLMTLVEVLPIALFISIYSIRKLKLTLVDFLNSLVIVGVIQSFLAIIMFALPGLRMFVFTAIQGYNSNEDKIFRPDLYAFRSFGFSQDMLFSLSTVQGIVLACVISLCLYNFTKYKYTLFFIPPLLMSILLNARIGLAAIIMFLSVILLFSLLRLKIYLLSKFALFSLISCLVIYLGVESADWLFDISLEKNIEWALSAFTEGQNFLAGSTTDTGNFGTITGRYWHLPDTSAARTFGEGRYLSDNLSGSNLSDIGYVRKIYFGGYMYSFLVYGTFIYLFMGSLKQLPSTFKPLFYAIVLTTLVAHIKGDAFLPTPGYRITSLILLFAICERRLKQPIASGVKRVNNMFTSQYQ